MKQNGQFRKNDIITVKIEDINNLGCGVGHLPTEATDRSGLVVFVNGAITGDIVSVRIIKVADTYLVGKPEQIITPSPMRDCDCFCEAPEACGGCVFRHMDYESELESKRRNIINEFKKAGIDAQIEEVRTTGEYREYRNKGMYPVRKGKNGIQAGFFARRSHNLIPAEKCALQPAVFADIVKFICGFADSHRIDAYDESTSKGLLRHIYIREGKVTGQIMVCLVLNGEGFRDEKRFTDEITGKFPKITSVMININTRLTNEVLGERYRNIYGNGYIDDILCGNTVRIPPASFYQVNHDAAELLYGIAAEKAQPKPEDTILDLYCGAGTIGLSMKDKVKQIIGIEIVPDAVEFAKINARLAGCNNAGYYCGDASDTEGFLARAEAESGRIDADIAIIDPPRKGSTPELLGYLAIRKIPKILYISCAPDTLARDCAYLLSLGYKMSSVTPVDMFPRTGHVETVVLLSKVNTK